MLSVEENAATGGVTIARALIEAAGAVEALSVVRSAEPETPGFPGLELANCYTINEYESIGGATPYELLVNGKTAMTGIGNDIGDAFLEAGVYVGEGKPETPGD